MRKAKLKLLQHFRLLLPFLLFVVGCTKNLECGFLESSSTVLESNRTMEIPISLSRSSRLGPSEPFGPAQNNNIEVKIPFTVSGTATNPENHNLTAGTLVVPAGATKTSLKFSLFDNQIYEPDKTLTITLYDPVNAKLSPIAIHTITITETTPPPDITFTESSQMVSEGAGTASFTVELSKSISVDATIPYTVTGNADYGTDHTLTDGTLTIPAGSTSLTTTFSIIEDLIAESDEEILITLGTPTNATLTAATTHEVEIIDNEGQPTANFSAVSQNIGEAGGTVTVTVTLSSDSSLNISVPFTVAGTATGGGTDHNLANGSISIIAGATVGTTTFSVTSDALYENNETVVISMGSPTNANIGATSTHTVNIIDDDTPPTLQFSAASQSVAEGVGTVTVTATLSALSGVNATFDYSVAGTATAGGTDHNLSANTITISAGNLSGSFTFSVTNDGTYEPSETVILTMSNPTGATLGATTTHTVTITDNDPPPSVSFSAAAQSVDEGIGTVTVTATLSQTSGLLTTVPFTVSGTATGGGTDHNLANGNILITAGSASGNTTFTVTDDSKYEVSETVIITMGAPTNASQGATTVQTVTITNNDAPPSLTFSASSQNVSEGAGTVFVIVVLNPTSGLDASVPYTVGGTATSPADHDLAAGTISISAGSNLGQQTFVLVDDGATEGGETVTLTMGVPTNASLGLTTTHTVNILDNDWYFDRSHLQMWLSAEGGIEEDQFHFVRKWHDFRKQPEQQFIEWTTDIRPPTLIQKAFLGLPLLRFSSLFSEPGDLGSNVKLHAKSTMLAIKRDFSHESPEFHLYDWNGNIERGVYTCYAGNQLKKVSGQNPFKQIAWLDGALEDNRLTPQFKGEVAEFLWFERSINYDLSDAIHYLKQKFGVDYPDCKLFMDQKLK